MIEHCCELLKEAVENEAVLNEPLQRMHGRILNEIDSDYAVRSPEERPNLYPINFCPFCGVKMRRDPPFHPRGTGDGRRRPIRRLI